MIIFFFLEHYTTYSRSIASYTIIKMVKKFIDAKVRPLANPSLEKTSLLGAARLYVSKDSLIALTNGLESNKPCVVEKILDGSTPVTADDIASQPIRREASLCVLPEKNLSPNVVMMTRAFQDATGFRVGDQVRIALTAATPDIDVVVVRDVGDAEADAAPQFYPLDWRPTISISMGGLLSFYRRTFLRCKL